MAPNPTIFNLSDLDGNNGFAIAWSSKNLSVSSAGDINGDGFDDLIIGADKTYVVFGKSSSFEAVFDLSSLDGSNGFVLNGIDSDDYSAISVSSGGDINGDGIDDLIIGAPFASPNGKNSAGESYVVFGKTSAFASVFNLSSLDGNNGFVLNGIDAGDRSGNSVSNAGDFNGDGFDDLIIGASFASPNGKNSAGESYVVFGSSSGFGASFNLSSLDGNNGFVLNGVNADDFSGTSISSAGDFNDDGFDDLILGVHNTGKSYVVFGSSSGFGASFNLSSLDGSNGFVLNSIDPSDFSGFSVSSAGDFNGDGFDDLIIGAYRARPNGKPFVGQSYVVFGKSSGFGASFNLSSLDGSNGFVINGIGVSAFDHSGFSVSSAGDFNGDGFDDLIIGTTYASQSYVVFGKSSGFGASFNLSSLDGSNGFVINGTNRYDFSGSSVSSAGDINGDGFDDLSVGANYSGRGGPRPPAHRYVIFGFATTTAPNQPPVAVTDTATINENTAVNISVLANDSDPDSNPLTVTSLNGSEVYVGNFPLDSGALLTFNADNTFTYNPNAQFESLGVGEIGSDSFTYTISDGSFTTTASVNLTINGVNDAPRLIRDFNLSSLDGSNGFVLNGIDVNDSSGFSVSSAGDINSDGIDDLIIGADNADANGQYNAGESYVVFGSSSGFEASLNLSSLNGSNGFVINGIDEDNSLGRSVSGAGDFNSDGINDLIIGAPDASPNGKRYAGESYVVFGSSSGFGASLNLSSLNGSNGFVLNGIDASDFSGFSVSSAGDINGDGFDDLIIGARTNEDYVVFGSSSGFGASLNLSSLNGSNGFVINGIDVGNYLGADLRSAGDFNGDGFDDLIIGAFGADPNDKENAGESYVVFGSSSGFSAAFNLSSLNGSFVINGIDARDYSGYFVSSAGDINGDGFDDLIIGAKANEDYVVFGSSSGFGASLNLSSLNGSNGFLINSIDKELSRNSISSAGDFNNDGFDDLIIGATYYTDPNDQYSKTGVSYVVFGSSSGFGSVLNLSSLDGSNGLVINGIDANSNFDFSLSSAGDINHDGFDDLIIGAFNADANGNSGAGQSYVIFGFAAKATTEEDTAVKILASTIVNIYTDIDGDTLKISDFTNPANGTLTFSDNGTVGNASDDYFIYTPNANYNGADSFTYTVNDGNGGSVTGTFNLVINPVNDAPVAVNDTVTAAKNTAVSIQANTLLTNDRTTNSSLTITGVNDATNGTAVLKDNGTPNNSADDFIVFTPASGFSGAASFNYTITDGQFTDTAKVTVQVGDRIFGGNCNDVLHGTPGNDYLNGGNGNDKLFGGNGKDILSGGNGNDQFFGGFGSDILTGGNGKDKFVLAATKGTDTITDFCKGTDLIGLYGGLTFNQLSFSGHNIIVNATDEILATLTGINTTTLTAANFTIV